MNHFVGKERTTDNFVYKQRAVHCLVDEETVEDRFDDNEYRLYRIVYLKRTLDHSVDTVWILGSFEEKRGKAEFRKRLQFGADHRVLREVSVRCQNTNVRSKVADSPDRLATAAGDVPMNKGTVVRCTEDRPDLRRVDRRRATADGKDSASTVPLNVIRPTETATTGGR